MKLDKKVLYYITLSAMLLLVAVVRFFPVMGEWYAQSIYPLLSYVLSSLSSLFPFSVGDLFIFLSVLGVLCFPLYGRIKYGTWKRPLILIANYLAWVYVWFYLMWGLNYFREDFFVRSGITPTEYTSEIFHQFLDEYVKELNDSYVVVSQKESALVDKEVKQGYESLYSEFGLRKPMNHARVKEMLFSSYISKVGVSGYMGPFFSEFNLNADLLPSQYASTYAHEMAHLLGTTSEAEANLYAYLVCTRSKVQQIRFSGQFALLPHVLRNAQTLLTEDEYRTMVQRIRPEVVELYETSHAYWQAKYSPAVGEVQEMVYDWFLKGNSISSGMRNYSEVIELLISYQINTIK